MIGNRAAAGVVLIAVAVLLGACTGAADSTSAGVTTAAVTTSAPTTTTTTSPPNAPTTTASPSLSRYEYQVPVGEDGISYRGSGGDIEVIGPSVIAAGYGKVYFADPTNNALWILSPGSTRQVDLTPLDILNVTAMALSNDRLYVIEVFFAPARQRLHELTHDGEIISTIDLPVGSRLEDGLSGLILDDAGDPFVVMGGGAAYADPHVGTVVTSISIGGHAITQVGPDIDVDGTLITADLSGNPGGLRVLGGGEGWLALAREEVTSMSPITVLATVEWYGPDGFTGSARVPLEEQTISGAPGLAVTEDGRGVVMIAAGDALQITELTPVAERITAATAG